MASTAAKVKGGPYWLLFGNTCHVVAMQQFPLFCEDKAQQVVSVLMLGPLL